VDITFAEPNDPRIAEVNESNCFNSNDIGFADVYTITTKSANQLGQNGSTTTSGAESSVTFWYFGRHREHSWLGYAGMLPVIVGGLWVLL
jgi:hypothetical protein